ncbi:MAG: CSLREA domain-containing protein, partial [Chloroflexi bacterium]|nr:CSLREA domain-containing protein [Chloroflexota bacterium]
MKTRFSIIVLIVSVAALIPSMAQASRRASPALIPLFAPTATPAIDFTVNSTTDEIDDDTGNATCHTSSNTCTLRAAIMQANTSGGNKVISLPSGTYTLSLTGANEDAASTGDLDIIADVRIIGTGSGKVIVSGSSDRVFHIIGSVTATITNVMIQNGNLVFQGGGIYNAGNLTLVNVTVKNNSANNGGGIYNTGTLTLTNSTVSGNGTGGIESIASSTLRLNSSTIASNTSSTSGVAGGITINGT